jgi:sugar phosphate isomerase/epimerase
MMTHQSPNPDLLSLNTATVREKWNLRQMIEGCARQGIRGISPWRDKLAELGAKEAAKLIRSHGLTVTGLCRGGMFPAPNRQARQAAIEDNLRAIDDAALLEARCLVLVVGGMPAGSKDLAGARAQVRDGIGTVLDHARACGVPLAIEPLHPMYAADRACVNTMAQANDLCDELVGKGGSGLGIALDVYHVWWDPQLRAEIERAGDKRLLAFHICDWLVPTSDLLLDRGMMGDGVIDIPLIRSWVEAVGYRGFHEVEIFSAANWWRRDPDEVLATCRERHQSCC